MPTRSVEHKKQPSLSEQLSEAFRLLEGGKPLDSLVIIKKAKAIEPRNVYILAFEKQVEQLVNFAATNTLTDERRTDIMDSIPGIIERAVEGAAVEQLSAERAQTSTPQNRDDKSAALEWLKDQYFQHAHEYVQQEQYEHALAEIRRVYIIDPGNKTALEFEQRIGHLLDLKNHPLPPLPAPPPPLRLVTKETLEAAEIPDTIELPESAVAPVEQSTPPPDDLEQLLVKTDEWSAPAVSDSPAEAPPELPPVESKRRGLGVGAIVLILVMIVAIGVSVFLLWSHHQSEKRIEQRRSAVISTPQAESFIGAPTTVGEQTFVISSTGDGTDKSEAQVESENPTPSVNSAPPVPETKSSKEPPVNASNTEEKAPAKKTANPSPVTIPTPTPVEKQPEATTTAKSEPPPATTTPVENTAPPVVFTEKAAEIIKLAKMEFSEGAALDELQGQVVIQVQIDSKGKPVQTKILQATNQLLIAPVTDAVMRSQFTPAQMSSGPVISWMVIPFKIKR